jgi:hypothetical protein
MSMNLGNIWKKNTISIRPQTRINNIPKRFPVKSSNENQVSSRAYWGTPTWFLFHTIAARINERWYSNNYTVVWNFICKCCGILPCPFCRNHAVSFTRGVNINSIKTKKGLQNILYQFHNVANTNSGKGVQDINVLDKYNRANIKQIFDLFEDRFFRSYIGGRHFDDWHKNEFKTVFINFSNIVSGKFI